MDNFGRGQTFELRAPDTRPNTSPVTTGLKVDRELAVGFGRSSQVVVAHHLAKPSQHSVLKFYDPTLYDLRSCPDGRKAFCDVLQSAEARAYHLLEPLQGHGIPRFEGEYLYRRVSSEDCPCFHYKVNLLEFVPAVRFDNLDPKSFTVDQKSVLKSHAFKILDKIHELGVYHHDLISSNLLWDGKSVTIIDFGNATFRQDAKEHLIDEWVELDKGQLMSTLVESVGIEDTRPSYVDIPSWPFDENNGARQQEEDREILWPAKFT
jgi:serine/threonine protein kinase